MSGHDDTLVTIYQKPTCTTCRQVYTALKEKGVVMDSVNYYLDPIPPGKLRELLRKLDMTPRALLLAIGAGVGIGLFFTVISFAPKDAGLYPVVFARSMSTLVIFTLALIPSRRRRTPLLPDGLRVRLLCALGGGLDTAANALFLLATQIGLLSIVSVLGSLYPAATVVLARYVLAERLRPTQKAGMVTAIAAAALLTLG